MWINKTFLGIVSVLAVSPFVSAQESYFNFTSPAFYVIVASFWLVLLTIISIVTIKKMGNTGKKLLFWLITIPVVLSTLFVAGHTIYENIISPTNGPVHWHADYEVWVCGERLDLINPSFPSNKIGTPVLHEHDDDRIHLEGTPLSLDEASLGNYFRTIGGNLEQGHFEYNAKTGYVSVSDGDLCGESPATLKVYVNGKLMENPGEYFYYPDPLVPPGDCVIVEFSEGESETTDRICTSWSVNGWSYDNYERKEITIGGHTYT